tara:strand:+ start:177 stop:503 length:327 start_codon:yes stop_codon:yes gene_type:complete
MVALVVDLKKSLEDNNLRCFGELLNENWQLKKQLVRGISNPMIDKWYEIGRKNGALGGKVLGAGAGGFLLFYAPKYRHKQICKALPELKFTLFGFDDGGSKIIYYGDK